MEQLDFVRYTFLMLLVARVLETLFVKNRAGKIRRTIAQKTSEANNLRYLLQGSPRRRRKLVQTTETRPLSCLRFWAPNLFSLSLFLSAIPADPMLLSSPIRPHSRNRPSSNARPSNWKRSVTSSRLRSRSTGAGSPISQRACPGWH